MIGKRLFQCFTFFLLTGLNVHLFAQTEREAQNIATLCKVWGFLKYYHPEVAKGKFDWDKEFMKRVKTAAALKSKEETSKFYLDWIESLGEVKKCDNCKEFIFSNEKWDVNLDFISDTNSINESLSKKLIYIRDNRFEGENFYSLKAPANIFNYSNEKSYNDSVYPSLELRLLALSRYWNIVYYFFPYKYLMDVSWNATLLDMIPNFSNASNTFEYRMMINKLIARMDDSHAGIVFRDAVNSFGTFLPPFNFKIIDEKIIVTGYRNDSICKIDDLKIGDVILKVNGELISDKIKELRSYISASNYPTYLRKLETVILSSFSDSLEVLVDRNGIELNKQIKLVYYKEWIEKRDVYYTDLGEAIEYINDDIVYFNPFMIEDKSCDSLINIAMRKKGIIIDMRCYPMGTVLGWMSVRFGKDIKSFASYIQPDLDLPGHFEWGKSKMMGGGRNRKGYKGKVIVLINEETQSAAEFSTMMLQILPNMECVGSQTAGADGNCSAIVFPGGYSTYMTGLGIYYPDGRETQRIGIVPDIEVKPTIQGIREGRDEVLEKAIEVINKQ